MGKNDAATGNMTFTIKKANDTSKNILVIHALNAFDYSGVNGEVLFDNTGTFTSGTNLNGPVSLINNQTLIIALNN